MDRGFIFGDGVYEVIPGYGGHLFRLDQHLQRLSHSLDAIKIRQPLSDAEWLSILSRLVAQCPGPDRSLYLQITRGVAPRAHSFPLNTTPTVFAMAETLSPPSQSWLTEGLSAITQADIRWQRCDIKTTALLANVLLRQAAAQAGADEAILLRDGQAIEGAASNLFVVRNGIVVTPALGHKLLHGVTRDLVLDLCRNENLPVSEEPISEGDLSNAEEVWLTSSTREVLAVTRLDGKPVGEGEPGPLWQRVHQAFQRHKAALRQQGSPAQTGP
ncbi:MAG: aminotransferase class IV [Gammaproteobacteria bacterium]|nr:aminotransferase class IV [Gammaproteobacteria bacterium]